LVALKEWSKQPSDLKRSATINRVKTGRTMAQIAAQRDTEWKSDREEKSEPSLKSRVKATIKKKNRAKRMR